MFLLDTSTVIAIINDRPKMARLRYRDALSSLVPIEISLVMLMELTYGAEHGQRRESNLEQLKAFLVGGVGIAGLSAEDGVQSGRLRAQLALAGTPIGPYDLLIAGQALHRRATLVTHNAKEFGRVPNLRLEVWVD